MSAEQNKRVVRRLVCELLGHTDLAVADQIVASGYVEHDLLLGERAGPQGIAQLSRSLRTAFPDGHFTINEQLAEADRKDYLEYHKLSLPVGEPGVPRP
jgi:hypothetical protein